MNVDRGDDFTPTLDDPTTDPKVEPKADPVAPKDEPTGDTTTTADPKTVAKDGLAAGTPTEGEGEGEGDPSGDDKPKGGKKDTRLPLARHEEILARERARREAVETELAKYQKGQQVADLNADITKAEEKLVELEKKYAKQVADGQIDEAAATMALIRRTERGISEQTAQMREAAAEARAVERVRYDMTVERLEEQYPGLNPDSPEFNKEKTAEVLELKEAYQLKGYTPSAALQKAVKLLMPPMTVAQEKAVEVTPRVDAQAVAAARKAAAVEKTAEAVSKTPANVAATTGLNSDAKGGGALTAKDVIKMSAKDFAALDQATLSKMRGDLI